MASTERCDKLSIYDTALIFWGSTLIQRLERQFPQSYEEDVSSVNIHFEFSLAADHVAFANPSFYLLFFRNLEGAVSVSRSSRLTISESNH